MKQFTPEVFFKQFYIIRILPVLLSISFTLFGCTKSRHKAIQFETIDTDFSKGRLNHKQTITLNDLEKFHGHLCDGLVVGALALNEALKVIYPNQPIDRTNLRIVSKPSPCLTDAAVFITGGRYQFNTFYVDTAFTGIYIIQRMDNLHTVSVSLNNGVKPKAIDSLGNLAILQSLSPCELDYLRFLEDDFIKTLMQSDPTNLFTVKEILDFEWNPVFRNDYLKTDVLNKNQPYCK
jgi:acetolactate decarboxylase